MLSKVENKIFILLYIIKNKNKNDSPLSHICAQDFILGSNCCAVGVVYHGCWCILVCLQWGAWCGWCRCWEMQRSMSGPGHLAALMGRCQPYASSTRPPSSVSLPWKLSPQHARTPTTLKSSSLVCFFVSSVHWKSDCRCHGCIFPCLCHLKEDLGSLGSD